LLAFLQFARPWLDLSRNDKPGSTAEELLIWDQERKQQALLHEEKEQTRRAEQQARESQAQIQRENLAMQVCATIQNMRTWLRIGDYGMCLLPENERRRAEDAVLLVRQRTHVNAKGVVFRPTETDPNVNAMRDEMILKLQKLDTADRGREFRALFASCFGNNKCKLQHDQFYGILGLLDSQRQRRYAVQVLRKACDQEWLEFNLTLSNTENNILSLFQAENAVEALEILVQ
jgi:hypothetical protein